MSAQYTGIDLFSGAGGLSLGAELAGVNVIYAVENDPNAAKAYQINHTKTKVINADIKTVTKQLLKDVTDTYVLFGGPPCQGFSTSNQKTRNRYNPKNWLFQEFVRLTKEMKPEWIVMENVKGISETEHGFFEQTIKKSFEDLGYVCSTHNLCASDYGVPQKRTRFFLIGSLTGKKPKFTEQGKNIVTVKDALWDLPNLNNGSNIDDMAYRIDAESEYAKYLRGNLKHCKGHLVSKNAESIIERYKYIPQGGNWENIPDSLMKNYKDKSRCHTGIYKRLQEDEPALTVGNYRKSMIIHPWEDRGLSVREAARIQSFPDWYNFYGSIGFQQQQVGNAVPPLLAKAVFDAIIQASR